MEDWERHIKKTETKAYCGAYISLQWAFEDVEHAKMSIRTETRIQPCKECVKIIDDGS